MRYKTIIALHAWRYEYRDGVEHQTYCDPSIGEPEDGWNVHLQHRDLETDDLVDPEGAPDIDKDFTTYEEAKAYAERLEHDHGLEIREY